MKKIIYFCIMFMCFLVVSSCSITNNFICAHEYNEETVESTCTKQGYVKKTCTKCGKGETVTLPLKDHVYSKNVVLPTCNSKGYTLYTCDNCDHSYEDDFVNALNHNFSEWEIIQEATEVMDGLKQRICENCKFIEEMYIASLDYIDHDVIIEPYVDGETYDISCYDELLLKFESTILYMGHTLNCNLNYEHGDISVLLDTLVDQSKVPFAYHVNCKFSNNSMILEFSYPVTAVVKSTKVYYTQYDSLNQTNIVSSRDKDFDNFHINDSVYEHEVETSDQLFYALERGVKPLCKKGSVAEEIYLKIKSILRSIIDDNMSDVEKVKAIYDYLIINVTYDKELLNRMYNNEENLKQYRAYYLEGVFLDKLAVCEGISKAMVAMCNVEGIPCVMVEGYQTKNPQGANHAWNKVYVNNNWYIVDATSGGTIVNEEFEILSYKYFLVDEETYKEDYTNTNFTNISCTNKYNIFEELKYYTLDGEFDFVISSQEELNNIIGYFYMFLNSDLTIEFLINFDYGSSLEDELSTALSVNYINQSFSFINNDGMLLLIK